MLMPARLYCLFVILITCSCAGSSLICINGGSDCDEGGPPEPCPTTQTISFKDDVFPSFSAAPQTCHTANVCHGSPGAQGGLDLSTDCTSAHNESTVELRDGGTDPRIIAATDCQKPEDSFFVQKSMGGLDHGGLVKLETSFDAYDKWIQWIREGATSDCE